MDARGWPACPCTHCCIIEGGDAVRKPFERSGMLRHNAHPPHDPRHFRSRSCQDLWVVARGGRPHLRGPARLRLRPARTQRRGQEHDHRNDRGPAPAHLGRHRGAGARRPAPPRQGQAAHRRPIAEHQFLSAPDDARGARTLRQFLRSLAASGGFNRRGEPGGKGRCSHGEPVRRTAPAPRRRRRAGQRSRHRLPRRADDRPRPAGAPRLMGHHFAPARPRQDRDAHDPLPRRSRKALRSDCDHRSRPDHCVRQPARAHRGELP